MLLQSRTIPSRPSVTLVCVAVSLGAATVWSQTASSASMPAGEAHSIGLDIEAHRGGRALRPENTLASFAYALSMGVNTLELDMGVTRDNVIVVTHDRWLNPDLARGPDGAYVAPPGIPYVSLTLAEVKQYDVGRLRPGSAYAAQFPDQVSIPGTCIPTLAEVIALVRRSGDPHVRLNIETKIDPNHPDQAPNPQQFVSLVLELLRRRALQRSRDDPVVRLANAATGPTTGPRDPNRLPDAAAGTGSQYLPRRALSVDSGFRSCCARRLRAELRESGGRAIWSPFFRDVDARSIEGRIGWGLRSWCGRSISPKIWCI